MNPTTRRTRTPRTTLRRWLDERRYRSWARAIEARQPGLLAQLERQVDGDPLRRSLRTPA